MGYYSYDLEMIAGNLLVNDEIGRGPPSVSTVINTTKTHQLMICYTSHPSSQSDTFILGLCHVLYM